MRISGRGGGGPKCQRERDVDRQKEINENKERRERLTDRQKDKGNETERNRQRKGK